MVQLLRDVPAREGLPALRQRTRRWLALRTRARQEKATARYLDGRRIEYELPLVERVTTGRHGRSASKVPLFPGYVFLHGESEDAYGAVLTKRVCQVVQIHDQSRFIREVGQIKMALSAGAMLDSYSFAAVGRRCRIRRGPLKGIEGIVIDRPRATVGGAAVRLVLQVNILGSGASLEIEADLLEACD